MNFSQGGEHWRLLVGGFKNEFVSWSKSFSTGFSLISLRSYPFSKIFTFTWWKSEAFMLLWRTTFFIKISRRPNFVILSVISIMTHEYHFLKILFLILEVLDTTLDSIYLVSIELNRVDILSSPPFAWFQLNVQTLNTPFSFVITFINEYIRLKFVSRFQIDVNRI
jgi:hypothetical protein